MKIWVPEELEVKTISPKIAMAQAAASKRGLTPKEKAASGQEREILAGPVAIRQVSLRRLGKAPPGTPLFQNDRPEIFKC